MKKTFLSTIVFVVLVSLFPLSPVIAEENDNLEALQVSQEIANISEKAIPSNLSEMEN